MDEFSGRFAETKRKFLNPAELIQADPVNSLMVFLRLGFLDKSSDGPKPLPDIFP